MCDRVVSENPFLIVYCPDKYIAQKMCDNALIKLIPDWFITGQIIKDLFTPLYADENILYFNEDSGNVVFSCNEMGIFNVDLNNTNLDNNIDEDYPDTVIHIRLLAWHIRFEKCKAYKKMISEELIPIAWHPKRWWNFCMSEDVEKETEPIFTEQCIQYESIRTLDIVFFI